VVKQSIVSVFEILLLFLGFSKKNSPTVVSELVRLFEDIQRSCRKDFVAATSPEK